MKKAIIGTALASGLLLAGQNAIAEDSGYIGLQYNMYTLSVSGVDDLEPDGLALKLGGNLNDNFQIETRLGRSLSDDNIPEAALKIDDYIGFYLKGGMDFANIVFPYIAVGYTKVDFEFYGDPVAQTESDISYGVGADAHFGPFQVGVEWMMLQDKTDYELENLAVSAAWRF